MPRLAIIIYDLWVVNTWVNISDFANVIFAVAENYHVQNRSPRTHTYTHIASAWNLNLSGQKLNLGILVLPGTLVVVRFAHISGWPVGCVTVKVIILPNSILIKHWPLLRRVMKQNGRQLTARVFGEHSGEERRETAMQLSSYIGSLE